ncbi:MAG TPA: transporter substrate-binding domain-containing protein [Xanthobacteraceae bacterium]|jgi:polar amino acid transport system substrate-binding protein|nr:transporter substrate-binding domain-containing protein [Xanthobacteraceae bacterium]
MPLRSSILSLLTTTAFIASAVASWSYLAPASAQDTPYVPDEWKYGRRQTGSTLQYCLDIRDPDLPVARKIGQAIAAALLLEGKPHELGQNSVGEDLDNLYRAFLETCDIYLGFKLIPDAYPQWLAVTRPYYRTSYVMVTANMQWNALADMPRTQAIGATIGTSADIRLIQYLQSLPADRQWSRFPMGSDELALHALLSGSIGAALVWGPSFWAMRRSDPGLAKLRVIAPRPAPDSSVDVGATLLARESFLRSSVDQAIAALTADGTIQAILDSEKFPATAVINRSIR